MKEQSDDQTKAYPLLSASRRNERGESSCSMEPQNSENQPRQEDPRQRKHLDREAFRELVQVGMSIGIFCLCFGVVFPLVGLFILSRKGSAPFQQPLLLSTNQHIVVLMMSLGVFAVLIFGCLLLLCLAAQVMFALYPWRNKGESPSIRGNREIPQELPIRPAPASSPKQQFPNWIAWIIMFQGLLSILSGIASFCTAFAVTAEADMTRTGFVQQELSINTQETVIFVNPANGVPQLLCLGSHDECPPSPTATLDPPLLAHGLRLLPGQSVSIVFDAPGAYQVISATTPAMTITIDVSSSS